MKVLIQHQTSSYMRLRLQKGRFSNTEAEVLRYALGSMKGISDVRLYPSSGGISFSYRGDRDRILRKLCALQFENVERFAKEMDDPIDREELARRKLSPEVKAQMRKKILVETAADILMPMPVQVGYHLYQLVTLKDL